MRTQKCIHYTPGRINYTFNPGGSCVRACVHAHLSNAIWRVAKHRVHTHPARELYNLVDSEWQLHSSENYQPTRFRDTDLARRRSAARRARDQTNRAQLSHAHTRSLPYAVAACVRRSEMHFKHDAVRAAVPSRVICPSSSSGRTRKREWCPKCDANAVATAAFNRIWCVRAHCGAFNNFEQFTTQQAECMRVRAIRLQSIAQQRSVCVAYLSACRHVK